MDGGRGGLDEIHDFVRAIHERYRGDTTGAVADYIPELTKADPEAFLDLKDIFGAVAESDLFRRRFSNALTSLQQKGTRATLRLYLEDRLVN